MIQAVTHTLSAVKKVKKKKFLKKKGPGVAKKEAAEASKKEGIIGVKAKKKKAKVHQMKSSRMINESGATEIGVGGPTNTSYP